MGADEDGDEEARQVEAAVDACFSLIAQQEQALHFEYRNKVDANDPDGFVAALLTELADLDRRVEAAFADEGMLGDAPALNAENLLKQADTILNIPAKLDKRTDLDVLAKLIARAQLLDTWFEPVFNPDMRMTPAQAVVRQIFDLEGAVPLVSGSLLLPRRRLSWQNALDDNAEKIGLFARYCQNLAYLPGQLPCDDPDALTQAGDPIGSNYYLWNSSILAGSPVPENPVIGVAPLAKRGSDVSFVPDSSKGKYELSLHYDTTRFAAALRRGLDLGVHILLVPEMALPEGEPMSFEKRIGDIIIEAQAEYFEETGLRPDLRLIIAGVLGGKRDDGFHRNYAVLFDANGEQSAFEQLKLAHWNLRQSEQIMFGIKNHHAAEWPFDDPIYENSLPGKFLNIIEIPGFGRSAIFICADMSQNNPGDWLSLNAMLDFLYAPIMDKSICWKTADKLGHNRPWIVRRTHRSAVLTKSLAISTNSISLSRWVNEANRINDSDYPLFEQVGIGLAINGVKEPPTFSHVLVDVDYRDDVELFQDLSEDWSLFPNSPK